MISTAAKDEQLAERPTDVWAYISPSRLNTWLRCGLAFKLRYVDGLRSPTSPSMFVGKIVHSRLEHFYRHRQLGIAVPTSDVVDGLEADWQRLAVEDEMVFKSSDDEASLKQQASRLVTAYLQKLPDDEPRPLAVETTLEAPLIDPFSGEDFGIPLLGVVDLVLSGDGPTVIDFKTAAKSTGQVEITHEVQLTSYAYLFRQTAGREEGSLEIRSLVKTKTPKIECHRYAARTDQHLRRFFELVRAYLDDLDRGRFVYRPGWTCSMCEFRDSHCRSWQA
ncbi:MAG: hypothetical protein CMJ64_17630 [Planctomycetaceae bacterium]|nr:hypothetical protein [Planctomycetaceae bacterium]